jgi:hypothetical protein
LKKRNPTLRNEKKIKQIVLERLAIKIKAQETAFGDH